MHASCRASASAARSPHSRRRAVSSPAFAAARAYPYDALRPGLRWTPFFWLFSRVTGSRVLNHRTRQSVYQFILQQPGVHYRGIMRGLSLHRGTLIHHLFTLERECLIQRRRAGFRTLFFPSHLEPPAFVPVSDARMRVAEIVLRRPGVTQVNVAKVLGLTRQAVHDHVNHLVDDAWVLLERHGRNSQLRPNPDAAQILVRCPGCAAGFAGPRNAPFHCPSCARPPFLAPGSTPPVPLPTKPHGTVSAHAEE